MLKLPFRFTKQDDTEDSFLRFLSLRNSNNICPIQKINILLYIIKKTYIEYYRNRWKEKQNERNESYKNVRNNLILRYFKSSHSETTSQKKNRKRNRSEIPVNESLYILPANLSWFDVTHCKQKRRSNETIRTVRYQRGVKSWMTRLSPNWFQFLGFYRAEGSRKISLVRGTRTLCTAVRRIEEYVYINETCISTPLF